MDENITQPEQPKKRSEQVRTSDFHPTIQVFEELGQLLNTVDNYQILLHIRPLEIAQPFLSGLRGIWNKVRPSTTETQRKSIDERFIYLQERIYNQQRMEDSSRMVRQEIDREILDGLPTLYDDVVMVMSKVGMWLPTTTYRDPQSKKNEYFRVKSSDDE